MQRRSKVVLTQVAIVLVLLVAWELGVRAGVIDSFFFPAPSALIERVKEWMSTADFWTDVGITLLETVLSFAFGIAIGTALGIWLGLSPFAAEVVQPCIDWTASEHLMGARHTELFPLLIFTSSS